RDRRTRAQRPVTLRLEALSMTKRLVYPPDVWGLYARSWELALRADNKSDNTLYTYIQAVPLLGEWAHRQSPVVAPADVKPMDAHPGVHRRTGRPHVSRQRAH